MKKLLTLLLSSAFILGACSGDEETKEENTEATTVAESGEAEEPEESTEGGVDVDKGLFNVEVTLPASLFEGEDMEAVIADAEAEGAKEATLNEDGSVTYKMSKSEHKEMLEEMATSVEDAKKEIVESGDYASVQAIENSNTYDSFTVKVDREAFENSFDGFATMTLGLIGTYYQAFDGSDPEELHVEIELKDAATGEVFDTIVYPDALEEMGE